MSHASRMPANKPSAPADEDEGTVWDVQVLAERKKADGNGEVLVLWKPSWISIKDMHSDCPAMRNFRDAPKARFGEAAALGALILPVEPGTKLADDCAWEQYRQTAAHADDDSSGADKKGEHKSRQLARETTKKLLGAVAKKTDAALPNIVKRQQQSRNK